MNEEDPFLQVQADVLSTLEATHPLFTSYVRIRSHASSPTSPELAEARADLESNLHDLSTDLADLVASVRAVEQDPYRYGLDTPEVSRRRRLVQDVGLEVENMRAELAKVATGGGGGRGGSAYDAANTGLPPPDAFAPEAEGDDDDYAAYEQQRQTQMMHEQDEALDGVFQTVENLRGQAAEMGRELEEQGEMLEDVDGVTDRVGGKLTGGTKRLGEIIRKNEDTMSSCCIGVLIVVLILLLILVIAL